MSSLYLFYYREVQKRAQGRKRIGKNFKKRWLRVTNRELSYHKHRGETCAHTLSHIHRHNH